MAGRGCRSLLAAVLAAALPSATTAADVACDPADSACEEQDESGLLSVKRTTIAHHAPRAAASEDETANDCLQVSATFPTCYDGDSNHCLQYTSLRFTIVDTKTLKGHPRLVSDTGESIELQPVYNGYQTPYFGNINIGRDQYSVYFRNEAKEMQDFLKRAKSYTIQAIPAVTAFITADAFYYNEKHLVRETSDLNFTAGGAPVKNPFVKGNPNIKSLVTSHPCSTVRGSTVNWSKAQHEDHDLSDDYMKRFAKAAAKTQATTGGESPVEGGSFVQETAVAVTNASTKGCKSTNTKVFRMSVDMSLALGADGTGPNDQCATMYLYSPATVAGVAFGAVYGTMEAVRSSYNFAYGYIRIKVPRTFNPTKEGIFEGLKAPGNPDGYDSMAWSTSSNWIMLPPPAVPFTVNSLMLAEEGFHNDDGDGYMLFAPKDVVKRMLPSGSSKPPILTLKSGLKAYLLPAPDFLWVFRYRDVSTEWQGSSANAPCLPTLRESLAKPASCDSLGPYAPQIERVSASGVDQLVSMIDA